MISKNSRDTRNLFLCREVFTGIFLLVSSFLSDAQNPLKEPADAVETRFSASQPVIGYTLEVNPADLSAFSVEMRIRNVADTFRLAMVAHPEYDDRFWRYVEDLRVETKNGKGNIVREDSALWRFVVPGGEAFVRYKIHLPPAGQVQRAAWRPFLSPTGGLVGGPHSFMYVVGATLASSHVTLKLPQEWKTATGLEPTADATTFFAPSVGVLVDSPILIGHFKRWQFAVDHVPHQIIYWPLPTATAFDTVTLVNHIQRFVQQTNIFFGRLPYREYSFLLQDGAYGALEHANSVTVGLPSADLAKDIASYLPEIAHEYFHTWNLMRIHPIEYGDVSYKTPPLSKGLWWSEGLTMFYADLLVRRAGLPSEDSSRIKHLEGLIQQYYGNPGNMKISPEAASLASYGPPGMMGDYSASAHLQGELLGAMLDIMIRDATNGKKSIDHVMRKMMERFGGEKGFTNRDIEQLTAEVCGCDVHQFFEDFIFGNKPIDLDTYLRIAGMHFTVTWAEAVDNEGKRYVDLHAYAFQSPGDSYVKLGITDPSGCWGRAGLHTGDVIVSVNKIPIKKPGEFRQFTRTLKIGDKVSVGIQRSGKALQMKVIISSFKQPSVHLEEIKGATARQKNLFSAWAKRL